MTPADRAAAVATAERVIETYRADPLLREEHAPVLARAVLDLAATVERVEALCAAWAVEGSYLHIDDLRAALAGEPS